MKKTICIILAAVMLGGAVGYAAARHPFTDVSDGAYYADDLGDKELNDLVKDLAKLFHDREWFLSGDTCEGDWNEARDAFKGKWFTELGRQERITKYLDELNEEIRKSFGMSKVFCKFCRHWTESEKDSRYGHCEFEKHCLMHRSGCCERWEAKE